MIELHRFGNASFQHKEPEIRLCEHDNPHLQTIDAVFWRFGHGDERTSDFRVVTTWSDVREAIRSFAKMGHPEALRIQTAIKLLDAAEDIIGK